MLLTVTRSDFTDSLGRMFGAGRRAFLAEYNLKKVDDFVGMQQGMGKVLQALLSR